jgi:LPS-assembly lipoprotein
MAASRRSLLLGLAGGLTLLVAGCGQIQPLYAPTSADGSGPVTQLAQVLVTNASGRTGLKIRNELVFAFNNGQDPVHPRYKLVLRQTSGSIPIGSEPYQNLPSATLVQVNVGFQLTEVGTDRILFQSNSFANAAYDYSSQRFANAAAANDAMDRAALVVAADIRTKLAAWFATHPQG